MAEFTVPVQRTEMVAKDTLAVYLDVSNISYSWKPGQNTTFELPEPAHTDADGNVRRFTLANAPNAQEIMIATRIRDESAFKESLSEVSAGDSVVIEEASGLFTPHQDTSKPLVCLAGGIGITPFRSMLEWKIEQDSDHEMWLFYSNTTRALASFLDELQDWDHQHVDIQVVPTLTREEPEDWPYETGRIDAEMLRDYVDTETFEEAIFYVAGPPNMVEAMVQMLVDMGVDEGRIKYEQFSGY